MKRYIIIVTGLLMLMAACKKDNGTTPTPSPVNSLSHMLAGDTSKVWIDFLRQYTLKGDNTIHAVAVPCYTDDHWMFYANGHFEFNEGASKCNPGDPYVYASGKWKLSNDHKSIEFSEVSGADFKPNFTFEIIAIGDDKLAVSANATAEYSVATTEAEEYSTLIPNK